MFGAHSCVYPKRELPAGAYEHGPVVQFAPSIRTCPRPTLETLARVDLGVVFAETSHALCLVLIGISRYRWLDFRRRQLSGPYCLNKTVTQRKCVKGVGMVACRAALPRMGNLLSMTSEKVLANWPAEMSHSLHRAGVAAFTPPSSPSIGIWLGPFAFPYPSSLVPTPGTSRFGGFGLKHSCCVNEPHLGCRRFATMREHDRTPPLPTRPAPTGG